MTGRAHHERGFLLVGVVIFVLALAILGMSLYSLSSYEAGFQGDSRDSDTAFYDAQAGLVMVQAVLALPPYKLITARDAVGHRGITYASATQRRDPPNPLAGTVDSSLAIDWSDTVTVTVRAEAHDGVHVLQARYLPSPRMDYYKRLFTVSGTAVSLSPTNGTLLVPGSIYVEVDNAPFDGSHNRRADTVALGDTCHVWQESSDSTWIDNVTWRKKRALNLGNVPAPDAAGYYANHPTAFVPTLVIGGGGGGQDEGGGGSSTHHYRFDQHAAGTVGYYATPDVPGEFSFHSTTDVELEVQGYAVWELPRGFRCENEVTITRIGPGPATLVIVGSPYAGRTSPNFDKLIGVWFFGGFQVPDNDVNVVLVSDGQVTIERSNNPTTDERVSRLSVYANALYVMGPRIGDVSSYDHATDMDAAIDFLEANDALPRGTGIAPSIFSMLKGSWRDLTP